MKPSNIIVEIKDSRIETHFINIQNLYNINKKEKISDVKMSPIDQDLQSNQTKIKTNKFSSIQALKNDRLDYKADLESLFYILCYLAKIDPTLFNSLEKKKILANQATLFVYKKQLIDQLGSNYFLVFIY